MNTERTTTEPNTPAEERIFALANRIHSILAEEHLKGMFVGQAVAALSLVQSNWSQHYHFKLLERNTPDPALFVNVEYGKRTESQ